MNALLLTIAMLCQELNPYPPRPDQPSPHGVIDSTAVNGPVVLNIDASALDAFGVVAETKPKYRVIVYTMPPSQGRCVPCEEMKRDEKSGDADIAIEYTTDNPPFPITGYPTVYMPEINQLWTGKATLRNLRFWHGLPMESPVSSQQPLMAGSASLGVFAEYLDLITSGTLSGTLPDGGMNVGSGVEVALNRSPWKLVVNGKSKSVTFSDPQPYIKYGFVKATLTGVDYDGTKLALRLKGLPDWSFKVN